MPYIKCKKTREQLDRIVFEILGSGKDIDFTGKLNYILFKLAKVYCNSYKDYRNFIGELEAAKLEIYRRQIAPYEDDKIKEYGDVL